MNAATTTLPMHSLGCVGCTARTPSMFDRSGDTSIRVRQSVASDGILRREALCDHCASKRRDLVS